MLETKQIDNSIDRLIVTGMIVSDRFLKEIQAIYNPNYMEIPFARTVAGWCLEYYKHYQKAPGKHIEDIYKSHSRNGVIASDMAALIGTFLISISHEYERQDQFNAEYLLNQAETRFKECQLKHVAEDVIAYISQGKLKEAEKQIVNFRRVERPQSTGINPFTDREAIYMAFEQRQDDVLFTFPDALGQFIGPIERSSFLAFMAPEKRGKSWWLMHCGMEAIKSRCNVAFFEVGDMTQRDLIRRIHINNTMSSDKKEEVWVPVLDCHHNQTNNCVRKCRTCNFGVVHKRMGAEGEEWVREKPEDAPMYTPCTACQGTQDFKGAPWYKKETVKKLSWKHAWESGRKTMSRSGGKTFKLSVHPNSTVNVHDLESILDMWEQCENFVPDVIIIDYADILAPIDSRLDERGRQNETWKALRALSQKRCCAVITATQADGGSYKKKILSEENYSEDKRKYAHATGFITLNQTPEEKEQGIMRIGNMFFRERGFDTRKTCTVLQCLDLGRPYITSYF